MGDGGASFSPSSNSTEGLLSIVGKNSSGSVSAISRIKSVPNAATNESSMILQTRNSSNTMVDRFRIDKDGRVDHFASVANGYDLHMNATDSTLAFAIKNNSLNLDDGTVSMRIRCDGNVENVNNSYGSTSDISLKENVVDANSQWDDIKALKVRNFNFKESTGFPTHTQLGLVAQEVETVSSGLVSEDKEGIKSVKYSVLYMKAVKALQEAMTKIESLEARVTELEG